MHMLVCFKFMPGPTNCMLATYQNLAKRRRKNEKNIRWKYNMQHEAMVRVLYFTREAMIERLLEWTSLTRHDFREGNKSPKLPDVNDTA